MLNRSMATSIILVMCLRIAVAEEGKQAAESRGLGLWNVNVMVDQAAKQIIERYKLNDEQAAYTRQLMTKRVKVLLDKHEAAVRDLFREALAMRTAGGAPSVDAIKSWAQRALPVYEDAKQQILEGNEEWGKILTPEQKKTHDMDLRMMKIDFTQYEQRLSRWSQGGFDAKKDWVVPQTATTRPVPRRTETPRPPPSAQPPNRFAQTPAVRPPGVPGGPGGPPRFGDVRPPQPTSGPIGLREQIPDPELSWDMWVSDFIRRCQLDEGQASQAKAILKDCKERASRHRDAHREEYLKAHRRSRELQGGGGSPEALAEANKHLADLNAPINDLFEELQSRVESIATSAQLQRYRSTEPTPK